MFCLIQTKGHPSLCADAQSEGWPFVVHARIIKMSTRSIVFSTGEFYHVYNRGVEKRIIFLDTYDYQRFSELLYLSNSAESVDLRAIKRNNDVVYEWERPELLVSIGAYCLMPNHFHILITPLQENGISKFMNKLCTSYSMYFNSKYKRTGGLYEGKFKAKWANTDEYLKYLFAYIHLNPVKLRQPDWKEKGINDFNPVYDFVSKFKYSSLTDYQNHPRPESAILDTTSFPEYFSSVNERRSELLEWLNFDLTQQR